LLVPDEPAAPPFPSSAPPANSTWQAAAESRKTAGIQVDEVRDKVVPRETFAHRDTRASTQNRFFFFLG
jgi:hypothetical protein